MLEGKDTTRLKPNRVCRQKLSLVVGLAVVVELFACCHLVLRTCQRAKQMKQLQPRLKELKIVHNA